MFTKVIVFLCAAGIASAGNLLHAAAPVAYSAPVSSISYSSHSAHAPVAYAAAPYTTYAASPVVAKTYAAPALTYAASPVVAKTYAAPVYAKAVGPAVSYQTVSSHQSHPVAYTAHAPVVNTVAVGHAAPVAYAAPVQYAAQGHYAEPAHYTAPVQYAAHGHYAAPVVKTLTYSAAPAVSHVSYSGLGASYAW